jgi:hypothetical protein
MPKVSKVPKMPKVEVFCLFYDVSDRQYCKKQVISPILGRWLIDNKDRKSNSLRKSLEVFNFRHSGSF